jgi:hypothetical protein
MCCGAEYDICCHCVRIFLSLATHTPGLTCCLRFTRQVGQRDRVARMEPPQRHQRTTPGAPYSVRPCTAFSPDIYGVQPLEHSRRSRHGRSDDGGWLGNVTHSMDGVRELLESMILSGGGKSGDCTRVGAAAALAEQWRRRKALGVGTLGVGVGRVVTVVCVDGSIVMLCEC